MPPAPASPRRPRLDRTAAHVCLCAFLLQCKPSEPHLVPYLTDVKGFSSAQVETDILPVSVYASLVFFLLAGPAASATSTKTVLVVGGACKLLTRVLLLWGKTLGAMRLMQVAFAAGAASDLMLYAYLAETRSPRDADLDVVRDARASMAGEGAEGARHRASREGPDAPTESSRVRFATGAASASALLGYMLAAELGQIAYERGAPYESLFAASLVAVALGCVGVATLPGDGDGAARKRAGGNADAPGASTSSAFSPALGDARLRAFGNERKRKPGARLVDAVAAACASCYGSTSAIALSAWWMIGTPPASTLETYVLSLLSDVEEGGNDSGGHVVFFARAASAAAAAAAARAPEAVASAPETYAAASAATAACAAVFSVSTSVATASVAYTLAVACVHGVSVLAFAQTSLCAAAARRSADSAAYDEMADAVDPASGAVAAADAELRVGSPAFASSRDRPRRGDDGLLFGLNSFFALVVLVLAQASVDASRGGARGAAAAAAAVAALAAAVVVFAAVARRFSSGADWAFAPTPSDVSFEWLRRLSRSCE
jgi:hypothetical protein